MRANPMTHSKSFAPRLLWLGALLAATSALAQSELGTAANTAACCQLTTSLGADLTSGRDIDGDEKFFMQEGAPPNIHFLVDTSGSMTELPFVRNGNDAAFWNASAAAVPPAAPAPWGCENPLVDATLLAKGWNPAVTYPPPDMGTGLGSDTGFPNLFRADRYYQYNAWADSTNTSPAATWTTVDNACAGVHGNAGDATSVARRANCKKCLNTKGYYKNPWYAGTTANQNFVFWGNFLNVNPPKYVTMKKVLKDVIKDLRRVRAGYSTFDGSNGARMRQTQNPPCNLALSNSSSFDSNRASYINAINGLKMSGNTPLAESVFNIGQYFSATDSVYTSRFGFHSNYLKNSFRNGALNSQNRSWCWGCQVSSVIIITDGEPVSDEALVSPSSGTAAYPIIRSRNGGPITCPDEDLNGTPDCPDTSNYKLDDITYFLSRQDLQQNSPVVVGDLNTAGQQSLTFYGIGLGISSPLLRNAVREEVGGGFYREAYDADELKAAILEIISAIETRATSFAAASISSLQINEVGGSLLPRFKPSRSGTSKPWEGFLYRFGLGKELVSGCDPQVAATIDGGSGDPRDYNGDGDCEDFTLVDGEDEAVLEDDEGNFVKFDDPLQPAVPYWEAGEKLKNHPDAPFRWRTRRIWTIVDTNGDRKYDRNDTPIEFNEANAAALIPYLGIGNDPLGCSDIAKELDPLDMDGMPPLECARTIIRYFRGADVFSPDLTRRDKDRAFLLHDIFHSSPIEVQAPLTSDKAGYEFFVNFQQLETLYDPEATPDPVVHNFSGTQVSAWDHFARDNAERDRIILVGSNGGMLHAFHGGQLDPLDKFNPVTGLIDYDQGTGEELWAFIPPDLMPRLRHRIGQHSYFVDGSAMVRTVWLDHNDNNQRDLGEFHTVAVMSNGVGGVHRFALDITQLIPFNTSFRRTAAGGSLFQRGDFMWLWPQPCDPLALKVGFSTGDFHPKPPPIGPVRVLDQGGAPGPIGPERAEERWVVYFNGGQDPLMVRGRGFAMVDIRTGNTLWKYFYGDGSRADHLRYPVSAPVGMVDIGGDHTRLNEDNFFDTANVGDYGGTVWTMRFWKPGQLEPDGAGGIRVRATDWQAARIFRAPGAVDLTVRQPFAYALTQVTQYEPARMMVYTGTGDRYHMQDIGGPHCRMSNPHACARLGCTVRNNVTTIRNGTTVGNNTTNYTNHAVSASGSVTGVSADSCTNQTIRYTFDYDAANGCTADPAGMVEVRCSQVAGDGFKCRTVTDQWSVLDVVEPPPASSPDRFYGVWAGLGTFSGAAPPPRLFNTDAEAAAYDARMMTEANLVDVTTVSQNAQGDWVTGAGTPAGANDFSNGWYFRYGPADERTGTQPALVSGSVIWNSFFSAGFSAVCSTAGVNTARLYQADYVTGLPNSAEDFYVKDGSGSYAWVRYKERTTVAIPAPPTPTRSVSGSLSSAGVVITEPGLTFGEDVKSQSELFQAVYQLEVGREAHQCRHEGSPGACR